MLKENTNRASSDKSQCLAFSKDHDRCLLERDADSKTCSIHHTYYQHWWTTTYRSYFDIKRGSPKQQEEFEFQLKNGHVKVPKWYFEELKKGDYLEYIWLIQVANCDPLDNRKLFEDILRTSVYGIFKIESFNQSYAKRLVKEIQTLLQTPKHCLEAFPILIFHMLFVLRKDNGLVYKPSIEEFWNMIFTNIKEWSQLLKSSLIQDCLDDARTKLPVIGAEITDWEIGNGVYWRKTSNIEQLQQCLEWITDIVNRSFQERTKTLRNNAQELKRDLAHIAFAPDRVSRLLEAGYEMEDI